MPLRNSLPFGVATTLAILSIAPASFVDDPQGAGAANSPASLSALQSPEDTNSSLIEVNASASQGADDAPNAVVIPAHEATPLGQPNTIFSARPTNDVSADEKSALSRLDPRTNGVVRTAGGLAIIMVLLVAVRSVLKRFGSPMAGGRPSGVLQILARFPIGRGQNLVLLQLGRRIVLVYQTKTAMTALSEMSDPDEVAQLLARVEAGSSEKQSAGFHKVLSRLAADGSRREWEQFRASQGGTSQFDGGEIVDLTRRSGSQRPRTTAERKARR